MELNVSEYKKKRRFTNAKQWAGDNSPALVKYGLLALILFFAWRILKGFSGIKENWQLQADMLNAGQKTYPNSQYNIWADALESAMYYWSTDEDAIKSIMQKMKTDADVLALISAFGQRSTAGIDAEEDLGAWLRDDLNDQEMNLYVNNVLASNGVNYRF